jgi:basic amino acid/polyamine antiporter, APA family
VTAASGAGEALERRLGVADGGALVVATVVGVGIFTAPAIVARLVPDPAAFVGVWALGGALALAGALAYAELAAMFPRAGGEYIFLREAFGPLAGFLSGWTSFVAGFSGAIAASAVGFAAYLGRLVPAAGDTRPLVSLGSGALAVTVSPATLVALAVIAAFTLVHLRGLGPGRAVTNALAALNVVTIALFVVLGFAAGGGAPPAAAPVGSAAPAGGAWLAALVPVMFTYSGWNAAAYVAGEIRDPGRVIPRALLLGTAVVTALYVSLCALYLRALGAPGVAAAPTVGDAAAGALFGPAGSALLTPLVLLALASSVSAMVVTGPRVYYAMARDGCMPAAFARVRAGSERGAVPARAIVAQSVWSAVLVLTGTFEAILTYTGFAVVLFAGAAVAALFVLRRRRPDAPRPYRAWGYPWLPAAFVAVSALMLVQTVRRDPAPSLAGLALVAAGVPFRRWTRSDERVPRSP